MRTVFKVCGLALAAMASHAPAHAELIFGLQGNTSIVSFDSATPGSVLSNRGITGLDLGDVLIGLDLRPQTDQLFSVATSGNLYRFTEVGGGYTANLMGNIGTTLSSTNIGIDFNPTADRLRIVSTVFQNLRVNVDNATLLVDGPIDPLLALTGLAYSNNFKGSTSTTLFGIDAATGSLVRSTNPNAGDYVTVGSLGLSPFSSGARLGFDISGATGIGYLGLNDSLYTVDLTTGAATAIGGIGASNIRGLTVGPGAPVTPTPVPEPATWLLMILGFACASVSWARRPRVIERAHAQSA
jgi:hypothetical protein